MGIKSFMGKREEVNNDYKGDLKVRDYMTKNLITFTEDQQIPEVMDTLIQKRVTGGPVVDSENNLVGIISDSDCMMHVSDSRYHNMPVTNQTVGHYMTREVQTIGGDVNILDAAAKFIKSGHRRFPVVEGGKLIGQLSRYDVIKAAMKLDGSNWR